MPPALRLAMMALVLGLSACTHVAVDDCGGDVLGVNEPRIRSSHWRMRLADLPAASERFVPYAAMSALTYVERGGCPADGAALSDDERKTFEAALSQRGWQEWADPNLVPACEDDTGFLLRVWQRQGPTREVVIAFRGTGGLKDWVYGNLHWLTRLLPMEDQYVRARRAAARVLEALQPHGGGPLRIYTTGHSLGGGLAQHILYTHPDRVLQAIAFDPSAVTGFQDQSPADQVKGCACDDPALGGEPRIYRVYDAYEILANLRIFHKIFFAPHRHLQEVRFPHEKSHSMKGLALYLAANAGAPRPHQAPWYRGQGDAAPGLSCTQAFSQAQHKACAAAVSADRWDKCPQ